MKKTFLFIIVMLLSVEAKSQMVTMADVSAGIGDSIDKVNYEVVYDLKAMVPSKTDTTKYNERMLLQIGSEKSAFFSYVAFQVDSMIQEQIKRGENVNINATANVSWKLYKNVPYKGKSSYLDRICNDNFNVVENIETPSWNLIADSTRDILGYHCRLAETHFKGRLWLAWYAVDIPIDNGPWKLQGLPGLILEAYDSNCEYDFTAVGLSNVHGSRNIYYKGKRYSEISRKDLNKIYKRFYNDAIGYLFMTYPQSSKSKVTVTDQYGNELKHSKPMSYNLLEW